MDVSNLSRGHTSCSLPNAVIGVGKLNTNEKKKGALVVMLLHFAFPLKCGSEYFCDRQPTITLVIEIRFRYILSSRSKYGFVIYYPLYPLLAFLHLPQLFLWVIR